MFYPKFVFTPAQEAEIVAAIQAFERRTSGEIRVHVEHKLKRPPVDEAKRTFESLGMTETAARNGVLILVAPAQKVFAIVGDAGIDAVTGDHFWDEAASAMQPHFASGNYTEALTRGIAIAGAALAEHFPYQADDRNELPDDISYA